MAYTKYSLTPANNTAAPPDGAPEGMLPSAVNDTMRDMMAQIRDCGDGIRGGTYTMTAPIITGGTINGATIGATTASTGKFTAVTNSALTSGRVTYAGTAGVLQDDADFTFNGTTVTMANDASISGLTVGKGGGASDTNTVVGAASALAANTSGTNNNAFGRGALQQNTTGSFNSAFGWTALLNSTTGSYNTAIGNAALTSNTTASNNTAVGYQALYTNSTSEKITAVGYGSLNQTTGTENTAIGHNSGNSTTSGYSNVYVGHQSGNWNVNHTTGYESVFIGNKTSPAAGADNNTIVIGAGTTNGKGSSTGIISAGGGGVYQGNNSATWSVTSDARLKKNIVNNNVGLEKLTQIQVRNFEYRTADEITDLPKDQVIAKEGLQLGVIAQELAQVLPECVKTESTGVMSVDTDNLTWYLINAVKELKAEVDSLKAQLNK